MTDTFLSSQSDLLLLNGPSSIAEVTNLKIISSATPYISFVNYLFSASFASSVVPSLVSGERSSATTSAPSVSASLAMTFGVLLSILPIAALPCLWLLPLSSTFRTFAAVSAFTFPFTFSITVANSCCRGYLDTRTPAITLASLCLANAALSYTFVHSEYLATALSIPGVVCVGLGTLCTELVGAVALVRVLKHRGILENKFNPVLSACHIVLSTEPEAEDKNGDGDGNGDGSVLQKIILQSTTSSFSRSLLLQSTLLLASFYIQTSSSSISAHQLATSTYFVSSFLCDSLAGAAQTVVAEKWGVGDAREAQRVTDDGLKIGLTVGVALAAVMYIFSPYFALLTPSDVGVFEEFKGVLPLIICCQPINGLTFVADGILQGCCQYDYEAKAMLAATSVGVSFACIMLALHGDPLVSCWEGLCVVQVMRLILTVGRLKGYFGIEKLFGKEISPF